MNVVLAIEELNQIYGGVERTVCNLANFLNRAGHGVTILTFEQPSSSSPAYDIAPGVQRLDLGLINSQYERTRTARRSGIKARIPAFATGLIRNFLALGRIYSVQRREVPVLAGAFRTLHPDVVVSFKTHFHRYVVPAAVRAGVPAIASDHNPPAILYYHYVCWLDRRIILRHLEKAGAIRTLLESYIDEYPAKLRPKCVSIPNGIEIPDSAADVSDRNGGGTIVNVGRLYFQKDQSTLVKAFATVADRYPDWDVKIYGDGEDELLIRRTISDCGLEDRVHLMGPERNITPAYLNAQIFALPSLFEGFGNVTLEALACGLPVVAFNNCAANRELIRHEENGILVSENDRVAGFAQGLETLIKDAGLRVRLGKNARETAYRFDITEILSRWEALIERQAISFRDASSRWPIPGADK